MTDHTARLQIWETRTTLDFDGDTLEVAVARLAAALEDYGPTARIFEEESEWSDSDRRYLRVKTLRDETDAEYDLRQERLAREVRGREARERAEYERLRALFGDR